MRTRLYSTSRPEFKPIIFSEAELTQPTLTTLQHLIDAISPSGLTSGGFFVALTLWLISGCDAVQISGLGYLVSALSEPVAEQPLPPHWLLPLDNFSLASTQVAILSSIVYAGMLVGGLFSSPLEKYNGSRPALLLCCISALLAYIGSAVSPNFVTLTICQAVVGISLGVRVAIVYSSMAQLFPSHQVGFVITTASFVWVLCSMYASSMGLITLGSLWEQSWRVYMLILTIPSFISLCLSFFFVYETLHFGVYKQFRPTPAIDLLKVHHGKVLSRLCKHFWFNLLCCCGHGCCGKTMGANKQSRSLANRYGSVGHQHDGLNSDTHSVADSAYSYDPSTISPSHQHPYNPISPKTGNVDYSNRVGGSSYPDKIGTGSTHLPEAHMLTNYQSNPIDPNDPHNDPYAQHYERKRKPSMFLDNNHSGGFAGTPTQGKTFDHEQYLTEELKQQMMTNHGGHFQGIPQIQFTSANTSYSDTGSRANSLPESSYLLQQGLSEQELLSEIPRVNFLQPQQQLQLSIMDDHYMGMAMGTDYIPAGRNKTDEFISTQLDQRDMSGLGLKLINLTSSKGIDENDGTADWNIDIDNPASVEELFDFLQKQLVFYTATLKYDTHNTQNQGNNGYLSPDNTQITHHQQQLDPSAPATNSFSGGGLRTPGHYDDSQNSTLLLSLQSDMMDSSNLSHSHSTSSASMNPLEPDVAAKSKAISSLTPGQQIVLLVILSAVWFIVSFQAAGFSSFLPLLWDRVFTNQSEDMKYIVSLIFSAVQLPAGLINMIIISRVFPPHLLLVASLISFFAMTAVTTFFKSQIAVATTFVFVCQFGLSTSWCAINFVALQYFPDDKKVLYYAVQASVGKLGAFVAQYVFAYLVEHNSLLLMIIVTILSAVAVLFCMWFTYSVKNATASH